MNKDSEVNMLDRIIDGLRKLSNQPQNNQSGYNTVNRDKSAPIPLEPIKPYNPPNKVIKTQDK